jgi:energy-coupling factor transporter transmembrane protein EcfT
MRNIAVKEKIAWSDISYWILAFIFGVVILYIVGINNRPTGASMLVGPILILWIVLIVRIVKGVYKKKIIERIPSLILIIFTSISINNHFSVNSNIDKRMQTIANEIQNICVEQQKCPLSLTQLFDDVKLIKPQSIFTEAGTEDEIADNPTSIEAAGYIVPNNDSKRAYTYKLRPFYGYSSFHYTVSSSSFLLSWIGFVDDMEMINITGGINSELLKIGPCRRSGENCKAISGYDL